MALTFNGTSSNLVRNGSIVTGYPFTIFAWTRVTNTQPAYAVEVAIEPGPAGTHEGHGIVSVNGSMAAWSTTGSGVGAYAAQSIALGSWVPCMVVFSSASLRKIYYGSGAVRIQTTLVNQTPSLLNVLSIGKKGVSNVSYWAGDLACIGLWRSELTATDFATLASGVVPSTVQSSTLIEYWSLLTQASTQTGVMGLVLAASGTSQAAAHPINEVSSDDSAPVLTGSISVSNVTGTSYNLSWPAATDNVGVTSYERSLDGGSTWLDVGNIQAITVSGRTPGTTDAVRIRAKDAAGNLSSALSASVTLLDTVAPSMTGTIAVSSITSTGYTLAWPPATDNVGVTAYEVSVDGGSTFAPVGNQLNTSITGRTPGSTDAVRVRAKDAAGNASPPLVTTVTLQSAGDQTPPVLVGAITSSNITTTSYNLAWPAATDNVGVTAYEVSVNAGATWSSVGLLLACYIGSRTPGSTDQVLVRAKDAAGNASTPLSTTVTLLSVADSTPPTLGGSITVSGLTSTGYTLSWGAGSDNVGITAYQYSVDGGTTWLTLGNVLTVAVTGRTPGSSDSVLVRARDGAGNTSTPPLATTVNLPSGGTPVLSTPPMKNNTGTLLANLGGIIVNVYDANTGALVLRKTGLSSNAAGVVSFSDAALVSGTSYAYEVVTPANGRRLPVGTAA